MEVKNQCPHDPLIFATLIPLYLRGARYCLRTNAPLSRVHNLFCLRTLGLRQLRVVATDAPCPVRVRVEPIGIRVGRGWLVSPHHLGAERSEPVVSGASEASPLSITVG
jgi:hypothetical protein